MNASSDSDPSPVPRQPTMCAFDHAGRYGAWLTAIAVLTSTAAVTAHAQVDVEIDGVYTATSNGEWATRNDVYHDQPTVVGTWTIETTCTGPQQCTGEVASDKGWRAPITNSNGLWYVRRTVEGWQHCPDGSTSDGGQIYTFYPVDQRGQVSPGSLVFAGLDTTIGASGACGVNQWLAIRMPLKLVKLA